MIGKIQVRGRAGEGRVPDAGVLGESLTERMRLSVGEWGGAAWVHLADRGFGGAGIWGPAATLSAAPTFRRLLVLGRRWRLGQHQFSASASIHLCAKDAGVNEAKIGQFWKARDRGPGAWEADSAGMSLGWKPGCSGRVCVSASRNSSCLPLTLALDLNGDIRR